MHIIYQISEENFPMYLFSGILLFICIIFFTINHLRKKKVLKKLQCMDACEKIRLLNNLQKLSDFPISAMKTSSLPSRMHGSVNSVTVPYSTSQLPAFI